MNEKKHIDRVFQEKLKDFDVTPNDAVWERIHAELHKEKRDRKVIPIWWKIAGIAASLLLLISIGNSILNSDPSDSDPAPNEVVDTENKAEETRDSNITDLQETDTQEKDTSSSNETLNNQLAPVNNNEITTSKGENKLNGNESLTDDLLKRSSNDANRININQKEAVVTTNPSAKEANDRNANATKALNATKNSTNAGVAEQTTRNTGTQGDSKTSVSNAVANNNIPQNLPEQPTNKETTPVKTTTTDGVAAIDISKDDKEKEEYKNTTDEAKSTIEDALALSEDEEDINGKEKEVMDRWSVTPNVSPVYYNTIGNNGSSIHSQFNNNSKSGQLNMSFGVNASYALSEKLSVRSGINKVNVGYNTNDVVVYQSLNPQVGAFVPGSSASALINIDLKTGTEGISVISGENLAFSQVPEVVAQNLQSSLDQEISFIEVPVELEYKLSDKKLGVSVIGGFSTMILNDNNVYAEVNDERRLLGEANNINTISYSANFGVGLGIKVSEKIDLNFEPTFKYQIKTFNNTSGDFNPYIIAVTSGLKFKF